MIEKRINISNDQLADFCRKWGIVELSLFGSALRDDFGPESDVDFMVVFAPDAHPTLLTMAAIEAELRNIIRRPVDVVSKHGVESSRNPWRRHAILSTAKVLYAA